MLGDLGDMPSLGPEPSFSRREKNGRACQPKTGRRPPFPSASSNGAEMRRRAKKQDPKVKREMGKGVGVLGVGEGKDGIGRNATIIL